MADLQGGLEQIDLGAADSFAGSSRHVDRHTVAATTVGSEQLQTGTTIQGGQRPSVVESDHQAQSFCTLGSVFHGYLTLSFYLV